MDLLWKRVHVCVHQAVLCWSKFEQWTFRLSTDDHPDICITNSVHVFVHISIIRFDITRWYSRWHERRQRRHRPVCVHKYTAMSIRECIQFILELQFYTFVIGRRCDGCPIECNWTPNYMRLNWKWTQWLLHRFIDAGRECPWWLNLSTGATQCTHLFQASDTLTSYPHRNLTNNVLVKGWGEVMNTIKITFASLSPGVVDTVQATAGTPNNFRGQFFVVVDTSNSRHSFGWILHIII